MSTTISFLKSQRKHLLARRRFPGQVRTHSLASRAAPLTTSIIVIEDVPAVLTVQQQQAEQMKVYWKVRGFDLSLSEHNG